MARTAVCAQCGAELPAGIAQARCARCLAISEGIRGVKAASTLPNETLRTGFDGLSWDTEPRTFGDYELLEEIDRGGMGVVFKARQVSLNRVVALKMILAGKFASAEEVRRFLTEAEAAGNLTHPNIVPIYDVGQQQGQHYFSMRFIAGRTLAQLVEDGLWRYDDPKGAARLVAKVARAIQCAHEHGVLHRDLKPGNILMDAEGEPHVTDFGLARQMTRDSSLTLSGAVLGTPSFMAPEQAAGRTRALTQAADIYSLGAILYYLLTGRPPFAAESVLDTLAQVLGGEVILPRTVNPRVPRDLEHICLRCLEKTPDHRYRTAGALADDLEKFAREEPVEVRAGGLAEWLRLWARRQPALASHLFALFACAIVSHATFRLAHHMPPARQAGILGVLALWMVVSGFCQWALKRKRWSASACFLWSGADALFLTVALHLAQGINSPLVALYLALIALSGLWLRGAVVGVTTVLAMLGYGVLLLADSGARASQVQASWHVFFLVALTITGLVVAYLVHRVHTLSRFYGQKPAL